MFVGMGANSPSGYNITDSLRFRSSATAYLNRTPTTAGNRKIYTWSGWIKRGNLSTQQMLFQAGNTNAPRCGIQILSTGELSFSNSGVGSYNTIALFRDPSAWYHCVVSVDATQALAEDRCKIYVNGNQQTTTGNNALPLNTNTEINNTSIHVIGVRYDNSSFYFDGYMTEVNFVDGQALDPSYFGSTNADGVWSPKKYTGTYGTNGFYLPMKETTQATGFNTVTYNGNGTELKVTGVGFNPDLVWVKRRDNAVSYHRLIDSVRGGDKRLASNDTGGETTASTLIQSFDADGYTVGTDTGMNASGDRYVAWCWDAGSSTVSNTDGTITSSVRANPATGFSVVTWTGNGVAGATIGHGLGTAPSVVITKGRSYAQNWAVYHSALGPTKWLQLNSTVAQLTETAIWNDTAPTSSVFTHGSSVAVNPNGGTNVSYCFSEVAGYSKFGSYTGTGSSGNSVTGLGFRPTFVLLKNTTTADDWAIHDGTRDPDNIADKRLRPNVSNAESTTQEITLDSDGFTLNSTATSHNGSGDTYIYMAFADTRDYQWNFDASGNKNNWTPNNINSNASSETTYDLMSDVPSLADEDTGNFATLNPLNSGSGNTVSDGNLKVATASTGAPTTYGTIAVSSGKWYWEFTPLSLGVGVAVGIAETTTTNASGFYSYSTGYGYYSANGQKYTSGSGTAYGATFTVNDVIGIALDLDAGTLEFYKNGVSQGTAFTGLSGEFTFAVADGGTGTASGVVNFGQRPFAYTPPTGYKKLNTFNLPDSSITDGSDYFITNTFTGTGATLSINTGFSPDFVWLKSRSFADHPLIYDTIRGTNQRLYSSLTNAESTATNQLNSFDSDGYTLGSDPSGQINVSGQTSVGWSWRGSDSTAVSNTDGTITSTVSANPTSGFSVVTYTGNGSANQTVGHGLGQTPKIIIYKDRSAATAWRVIPAFINDGYYLALNDTSAMVTASTSYFGSNTSTTLGISGSNSGIINASGNNLVAYAFADVEGFSKFGSYTGNGSTDGPFVYTGFRPAFVMIKRTSGVNSWNIIDNAREGYNPQNDLLFPDSSNAESNVTDQDILSNGFKFRTTGSGRNGNGETYIYMAFAENPFKNSLAR